MRGLRAHQFAEDAGPLAHPVRPASYIEINNFYTSTVYEKGAELVRMQANLLGPALFRQATDLYFARHDGQAVTTDDFVTCMEDASGRDLTQFRRWYEQAGTPELWVQGDYDPADGSYTLTRAPAHPGDPGSAPEGAAAPAAGHRPARRRTGRNCRCGCAGEDARRAATAARHPGAGGPRRGGAVPLRRAARAAGALAAARLLGAGQAALRLQRSRTWSS